MGPGGGVPGRRRSCDSLLDAGAGRELGCLVQVLGRHDTKVQGPVALDAIVVSRMRETKAIKGFLRNAVDYRSNRKGGASAQRNREAFGKGFDTAQRSVFKILREGPPDDGDARSPSALSVTSSARSRVRVVST